MEQSKMVKSILEKIGNENLITEITSKLSQSEISTLLLAVSKEMTNRISPTELLNKYRSNRFVKPSKLSLLEACKTEAAMLERAEMSGFSPVMLSPAGIMGSCSVIGKVDQNNVISAVRGLELISDSTNMLAIYLADGIKNKTIDNTPEAVHLCTVCRVVRGQMYKDSVHVPHFGLFSLVSSGKDTGSYSFEKRAIIKHIGFYSDYFRNKFGHSIKLKLNMRNGYSDKLGFLERILDSIDIEYPDLDLEVSREESDNSYYQGLNFKIIVKDIEVADGGYVDWTQKLLENKKERLLISGTGIDLQLIPGLL